jgi:hypothetical protein
MAATAFERALQAGQSAMNAFAGASVEYRRGSSSAVLTAIYSPTRYPAVDGMAATTGIQADDWLIDRAAIDTMLASWGDNEKPPRPRSGDRIIRTKGSRVETYEVQEIPGRPCAEQSGPLRWRIHSKLISSTIED